MEIWVRDEKTGEAWVLDNDSTRPVYNDADGKLQFELNQISKYKFYPCDPNQKESEKEGYQFNIFDFLEEGE